MHILELATQGVRGFSPSSKTEFAAGYGVLLPPSQEPVPLGALLSTLLYPDGRSADSSLLAAGVDLGSASLIFRAKDGSAYYLAGELGGVSTLHRANESTNSWELVADEPSNIADHLRSSLGLPPKKQFEQAFTLTADQFPTLRPKPRVQIGAAARNLPEQPAATRALSRDAAKAKIDELSRELQLSKEIERWQFQLDGIVNELAAVDSRLAQAAKLEAALKEAQTTHASVPTAQSLGLPADIVDRAKRFPQLVAKRDEAMAKLEAEPTELAMGAIEPLKSNARFWGAAGIGAVFFALEFLLRGPLRYLGLLDIPAFGFAALLAVRYVDELHQTQTRSRKGERRSAREKKISEDFEAEAQWVKKAMAALKVESPTDIAEALAGKGELKQRADELASKVSALQADPEYAAALAKRQTLTQQRQALEAKMSEKGGYVRDAAEIQRELSRVKASASPMGAPSAPIPGPSAVASTLSIEDPFPPLLALAADLLMMDAGRAAALVQDAAKPYVLALTDQRYSGIEVDRNGKILILAGSQKLSARELPPRDLDLLYLSVRLALVAAVAASKGAPLVVEDVGAVLEPRKLAALAGCLKRIGSARQVLHVSADAGVQGLADSTASL